MNSKRSTEWTVHGPYTMTNHKGEYGGQGWQVNRRISPDRMALEYVMDGKLVKFFKTEAAAIARCKSLNRQR